MNWNKTLPCAWWFFLLAAFPAFGQDPCGCEQQESINICYLSYEDYCGGDLSTLACQYSLDGPFLQPGLGAKLLNGQNFGPSGIASCGVSFKKLPPITGVETLESCDCDIVFVGQFPAQSPSGALDLSISNVPDATLGIIREWSALCASNLVIVTQAEANPWGYITENENINPNRPAGVVSISIFDGAFGSLADFQQGGSFQGVFTQTPPTGAEILAEDALGRPTVVLDEATNDIILADIGILCTGAAGQVSQGGAVLNNNDILACNLFALGCRIAEGVLFTDVLTRICPGDSTLLPDGVFVSQPGRYVDTLLAANGCDSIIETEVRVVVTDTTAISPPLCEGDDFSITINGTIYDRNNPVGEELLQTVEGCDSVVRASLFFAPLSFDTVRVSGCRGDGFRLEVNGVIYDEGNPVGQEILANQYGCDSLVTIDLFFEPQDTTVLDFERCEGDVVIVDDESYEAGTTTALSLPVGAGCDSVVIIRVAAHPLPEVAADSTVEVNLGEPFAFDFGLPPGLQAQWAPAEALSCSSCPAPELLPGQFPERVQLTVVDSNGCASSYSISPLYICNPYLPNAFSPNDDGRNDRFYAYFACPVEGFRMDIYNRWGALVYRSESVADGWDGFFLGKPAPAGVYAYVVVIQENGREKTITGEVNLLR
ncbi:MAG: gliding motility-associated C-terminal domain-containing protein [Phaeodactylibacter sp.]|nr:gliding motility-associated C-terminal domain-containing protein [Phaeodactylibacter sp.]MCB9048350.1 gliding motility-associated C-terminal domain-containing protein [Lewinellaceae bacterium]